MRNCYARRMVRRWIEPIAGAAAALLALAACGAGGPAGPPPPPGSGLTAVAAENFWGSVLAQAVGYRSVGLAAYQDAIAAIRSRYAGVPVGASESIFAELAPALGLDLVTPPGYLKAVSEGIDISAADRAAVQRQIAARDIRVL